MRSLACIILIAAARLSAGCCKCSRGASAADAARGPCGLTSSTRFPDDPALVPDMNSYAANTPLATDASAEERQAHCSTIWNDAVEAKHCGQVVIPGFCESCGAAERDECREDNHRGRIMQRCREEALPIFQASAAECKGFVLCGDKLQHQDVKCAHRPVPTDSRFVRGSSLSRTLPPGLAMRIMTAGYEAATGKTVKL